jgi:hypothetical protein
MLGYRSYSNAPSNKNTEMQFPMGMKYEKTWTLLPLGNPAVYVVDCLPKPIASFPIV